MINYEEVLLRAVQSRSLPSDVGLLGEVLDHRYANRLFAYQSSFRGRVVNVLCDTVLEQVKAVFNEELIGHLLLRYFSQKAPREGNIVSALEEFPGFVAQQGDGSLYSNLLESLLRACLAHWRLWTGADPEAQPRTGHRMAQGIENARLIPLNAFCTASDSIDLWRAWIAKAPCEPERFIGTKSCGFLIVKTSPLIQAYVPVSKELNQLVEKLCEGLPVSQALEGLAFAPGEEELKTLFWELGRQGCFGRL